MRNSLKLLALGLVLFLEACSVSPDAFLENVKGKTVYETEEMSAESKIGTFSADSKIFDREILDLDFIKATSTDTAVYEISGYKISGYEEGATFKTIFTFTTTDGKTGKVTTSITIDGKEQPDSVKDKPIWFK